MRFELQATRFHFQVLSDSVYFPPGNCGNIVRGAFGRSFKAATCGATCTDSQPCAYHRLFAPRPFARHVSTGSSPSGLGDSPRPFVIRAWNCDGLTIPPGGEFWFDFHRFDVAREQLATYAQAFERFAEDGIGPRQTKARLVKLDAAEPISIDLSQVRKDPIHRLTVEFATPTEIKSVGRLVRKPAFRVLFARVRDRVSTLRAMYGEGPLAIDFRGMAQRASGVRLVESEIERDSISRRSSRTGNEHPIGGFTGRVTYASEKPLNEFIPYLQVARWTGVGRQTVWGNGELRITEADSEAAALAQLQDEEGVENLAP